MILSNKEAIELIRELKGNTKVVVFTNGCFDILHRGHAEYLDQARTLGDFLIVAVNSDSSVRRLKGEGRPVNSESDRAFLLSMLRPVDAVTVFDEDTPYEIISELKPDVLVKGGDWKPEQIIGSDIVLSNGGRVISLKYVDDYSTTNIINKISEAEK